MTHEYLIKQSINRRKQDERIYPALKTYGLTPGDWMVIGLVHEGEKTLTQITNVLETSRAYVTVAVRELVKSGWLHKTDNENDPRSKVVSFVGDEEVYQRIEKYLQEKIK